MTEQAILQHRTTGKFDQNIEPLACLVHAGVAKFARRHLVQPSDVFAQIEARFPLARACGIPDGPWRGMLAQLKPGELSLADPMRRLFDEFELGLADCFLLTLCGEAEDSHWMNLALAELQAPDASPRLTVHLACHLLRDLFLVPLAPSDLIDHPLVVAGVLDIVEDGPLPLRRIAISEHLWRTLNGKPCRWPGVTELPAEDECLVPQALVRQLPGIAQHLRLGEIAGVVFRGGQETSTYSSISLANYVNLTAVSIDAQYWLADNKYHLAARFAAWLPVIKLQLAASEKLSLPQLVDSPVVYALGKEGMLDAKNLLEIDLPAMAAEQRRILWQKYLPDANFTESLAQSALLEGPTIKHLAQLALNLAAREQQGVGQQHVLIARNRLQGNQLRQLAQPVERVVPKDALVLPPAVDRQIAQLLQRCRAREVLWQGLGPSALAGKSFGVRALFSGESGTGKTLAASYLATQLGAPMYRLDLAAVMNKYIGETEKNLGFLLDEAAAADIILLMDEADALFGKRTDSENTGDRFANMLTNFLLTRIETHPGIVVLTTNGRSRMDNAFTRRIDAIVEFPTPGVNERFLIWEKHLGERSPGEHLSRLLASYSELPGGSIRNAVLSAAMECPGKGSAINELALLQGAMGEYKKNGRAVPPQLDQLLKQTMLAERSSQSAEHKLSKS